MSPFAGDVLTLVLGFAISGAAACAFESLTARRASFRLLQAPDSMAVIAVPVVTLAAPYILARGVLYDPRRRRSAALVALGVVLAGLWSLALGAAALSGVAALAA